jgi:hypothetical protein
LSSIKCQCHIQHFDAGATFFNHIVGLASHS